MPAWAGALAGLVSGAVALGISQLVAALVKPSSFPVLAVGDAVVDASPPAVKDFAIATFGENDKTALVIGVVVVLGLVAAALGVLARHRLWYGQAGLAVFAAVGVWAVLTRPDAGPADALPTLVGVAAAMLTLPWLLRRATADKAVEPAPAPAADGQPVESPQVRANGLDRRGLLTGVAGGAVVAGVSTVLGRSLAGQSSVDTARSRVALPSPAVPAKPLPAGVDLGIRGLSPFITPNDAFYRVDTALLLPKIDPADWVLRIHGMVDRPIVITYADLLKRPSPKPPSRSPASPTRWAATSRATPAGSAYGWRTSCARPGSSPVPTCSCPPPTTAGPAAPRSTWSWTAATPCWPWP